MPREILWTDAEEIGIQLQEKFPDLDPLTVRFTDLHRYVTELRGLRRRPGEVERVAARSDSDGVARGVRGRAGVNAGYSRVNPTSSAASRNR